MSLPIKDTPVLTGKDAERFLAEVKENENRAVSKEELERMKKNYEIFKAISNGKD